MWSKRVDTVEADAQTLCFVIIPTLSTFTSTLLTTIQSLFLHHFWPSHKLKYMHLCWKSNLQEYLYANLHQMLHGLYHFNWKGSLTDHWTWTIFHFAWWGNSNGRLKMCLNEWQLLWDCKEQAWYLSWNSYEDQVLARTEALYVLLLSKRFQGQKLFVEDLLSEFRETT